MNMMIKEMKGLSKEEKKFYKPSGHYRGKNRCTKFREHDLQLVSEKNMAYDVAVTVKDILKHIALGEFEIQEVENLVGQGIEDPFKVEEVSRDIKRYCISEQRTPVIASPKYFAVPKEGSI